MSAIKHPLEFEKPLVELEDVLERLRNQLTAGDSTVREEFARTEQRLAKLRGEVYGKLSAYQRVQLSRHFDRPCSCDYFDLMATDFLELHGDRLFRDDPAIVGGLGKLGTQSVMFIGQQRGRTTAERLKRNFGMPNPEGYRKALRLFRLAEKFNVPIVNLIDTQGAFPGLEAEERGQAEAIARNLSELSEVRVPVISVVIGEGGSGGALALGVTDKILMLENACYSVITPEGCASILWHHDRNEAPQEQAAHAAEVLQITAEKLKALGVIDEIVPEPVGGAHRNYREAAELLKVALLQNLNQLSQVSIEELLENRYQKFRRMGPFTEN